MSHPFPYSRLPYVIASGAPKGEWTPSPPVYAELDWRTDGPYSVQFGDCYFSRFGGLQESRYVFLEGSDLEKRFLGAAGVCIAELGFGTGLNFLATISLKQELRVSGKLNKSDQYTHYIAFERYPLSPKDLRRAHDTFPTLGEYASKLQRLYPPCVAGVHKLVFEQESMVLHLVFGDVREFLPLISAKIDTWFLDGFTPSKNDEMWTTQLFEQIDRLSAPQVHLATFSAARIVRDSLEKLGFTVEKLPGFATKRNMIVARRDTSAAVIDETIARKKPNNTDYDICVVGGGLAGASVAWSFARRNYKVLLLEEQEGLAQEASGNPAGVLMPYFSVKPDFQSRFYLNGFLYTLRVLQSYFPGESIFKQIGVLRLASSARLKSLVRTLDEQSPPANLAQYVNAQQASEILGLTVADDGFWHESAGMVMPRMLVDSLLKHPNISVNCGVRVDALSFVDEQWRVEGLRSDGSNQVVRSPTVVLSNAFRVGKLSQSSWVPLEPVKGQLVYLENSQLLDSQKTVLCFDGYLLPREQSSILGATYVHGAETLDIDPADERKLINKLCSTVSEIDSDNLKVCGSRAAFRTMSPDRMPIVGMLPDCSSFEKSYLDENSGKLGMQYPAAGRYPGLFVSLGHGSRGLVSCLLSAEIIAAIAEDEPLGVEQDLFRAVDPARFLVRALKRGHNLDDLVT